MSDPRPTVVLTGASRGIGHATVQRFSNEGWQVITCSRDDIPEHCKRDPNWTHHIPTDLSDAASVASFIEDANEILGDRPLHALVNNAAVSPKASFSERLGCLNGDIASWRGVFELNFFTPLSLCRGLAQALGRGARDIRDGEDDKPFGAAIVNITSIAGHAVHPFAGSAYSTSKSALSALTREMSVEFAQLGVRVNAVAPGEIATEMIGPEYEPLITRIPLQRMGEASEVASCVFQLCRRDFSYVTGTEVFVTGGQHLY